MARTVLVTGGSRGIGYATAALFAVKGWNVAFCGTNESKVKAAENNIITTRGTRNVLGITADLSKPADIGRMFNETVARFGSLDALVNNAAIIRLGSFPDFSMTDWDDMLRVNLTAMMLCCQQGFQRMNTGGAIVNISSLAGVSGLEKFPKMWGYSVTKAAVIGLTESLAVEGKARKIRVNCVAPGATDTDMLKQAAPGLKPDATPADVAQVIYTLADSEQSAILSGTTVPIYSNG